MVRLYIFFILIFLVDLNVDFDYKFFVVDLGLGIFDMKFKVFKGISLFMESVIIDLFIVLVTFYMDINDFRIFVVVVVFGLYIYVYKNLRSYFKFILLLLDVNVVE